jgi:ATP-binding cassette subfamily C protein
VATSPTAERPLIAELRSFSRHILNVAGFRALFALGFLLLGSITEGISILVLLPILKLVGGSGEALTVAFPTFFLAGLLGPELRIPLAWVLAFLVVLLTAQALFNRFKSNHLALLLFDVVNGLRVSLFDSIGHARWRFIAGLRGSDLHHALTADIDRVQKAAFSLLLLVQDCILLVAYLVVSWLISPPATVFAFAMGGAVLAILKPIRDRSAAFGRLLTDNRQQQYRTVSEFLAGIKVAKSFGAEPRCIAEFSTTLGRMRVEYGRFVRLSSLGGLAFQVSSAVVLAVFVYAALAWFALPMASIVVLILVFLRMLPCFSRLQAEVQEVLTNLPAFHAMRDLQEACEREREQPAAVAARTPTLERAIEFDRVSFRYTRDAGDDVLRDVSFTVAAGKVTALIGASGSGKTTVADLMTGLLSPSAGRVVIDGMALNEGNARAWRDTVAYVPQDVFLLHDTIAANLRLAVPDASEAAIWDALRAAHADRFVTGMPMRLETVVGDRGLRLSGGERQRIALARALLRRPRLLVLDEATSALDWENQALIARSMKELSGRMTIVTIAHRPSMIAFADWVVAFERGAVVEAGPYSRLIGATDSRLAHLAAGEEAPAGGPQAMARAGASSG